MRGDGAPTQRTELRKVEPGVVPLSFVQERQLFLELLDPFTAVNNLAMCMRIDGRLDLEQLERSANQLVARHDVLRMSFQTTKGKPVATIAPSSPIDLGVVDLRDRGPEALTEAVAQAEREAGRPFALDRPPLLRVRTYLVAADAHVLVVVVHHTIADGWSLGIFLNELFSVYQALVTDAFTSPEPLPMQYADFAAWQRGFLDSARIDRQLSYWTEQLGGELPVLDLPIDHPRPTRQTFDGATYRFQLPATLMDQVKTLSKRRDMTPFMTLVAAFQVLLHRFCGQDDILVGTPIAGRTHLETESLIGAFINTLVLRTDVSGDPTFDELLQRVRTVALSAYAHQDLPFEKLVAALRPQRDLSRTPIFQVAVNLQSAPLPSIQVPGLSLQFLPIDRGTAQFDLTLLLTETGDGLDAEFEFNVDLFEWSTIERLAEAFRLILEDAVADPGRRISTLTLMRDAERQHLLYGLNETKVAYPRGQRVHELFEIQAHRTPDAVAIVCNNETMTYEELDHRANELAANLRRLGVGPDMTVGVCLDRSLDLMAALLAVWKVGGAYLPIDPCSPAARTTFMLRDAYARVLLTDGRCDRHAIPETTTIYELNGTLANGQNRVSSEPPLQTSSQNRAYVIFTSGSTGEPKGVPVSHQAVVNLLHAFQQLLELDADDRFLAVTSISFDISVLELFLPLITGARVVLATPEMTMDSRKLQDAIAKEQISIMQATPSMWRMMLRGEWPGHAGLVALSGGEPLTTELAERLVDKVGTVWNLYGPTETTVWSSATKIRRGQHPITIGQPIANTQLYVLDDRFRPVPVGVTGQLHIGGAGVSPGYLNRPELTTERFVPNPFARGGEPSRMFRTGDRARRLPDGSIQLLGRSDDQVKIHGFRVELGEIEAALSRHPDVREVSAAVRESGADDKSLLAYFVATRDPAPDAADLRAFLRSVLPAYMVPAVFVPLRKLPKTNAGKVDRIALESVSGSEPSAGFAAPSTPLEDTLASIYAQVLGIERVGVLDNFFDLGGGSIQILEIIVHAQGRGLSLTPELFFEHQTVAELASHLTGVVHDA